jgi:hypothetical protein
VVRYDQSARIAGRNSFNQFARGSGVVAGKGNSSDFGLLGEGAIYRLGRDYLLLLIYIIIIKNEKAKDLMKANPPYFRQIRCPAPACAQYQIGTAP